ncbi:MAG: ABC transporter ATP-binding protein [Nitrospiraceae bacterium]
MWSLRCRCTYERRGGDLRAGSGDVGRSSFLLELDWRVGAGEWVVLVGPSGAGKSIILGLAAGLLEPDEGACWCWENLGLPVRRSN